jgi:hypothetical protein
MSIFVAWFLRAGWKYLAVIAIVTGAYYWAHHRGAMEERAAWQAAQAKAIEAMRKAEGAMQDAVDTAAKLKAQRDEARNIAADRETGKVTNYYVTRPNERAAVCLPADRVQPLNSGRAAIAGTASPSGAANADAGHP